MPFHYLDFDFTDGDTGAGSYDTMACVTPDRLPALTDEIATILNWAAGTFGPSNELDEDAEWGYALTGIIEPRTALMVSYDAGTGKVTFPAVDAQDQVTLTLTISGSSAFCDAFQEQFEPQE